MPESTSAPSLYRVLVVDDSPDIRQLVCVRLGFEDDIEVVGQASNGEEAVRLVKTHAPSAVVIDLEMPVMRGDEAIPLLRAVAPGMGIVLYTAAVDVELEEDAVPDAFVAKGVPLDQLLLKVRAVLEQTPFEVLRLELGPVPLMHAVTAFDTWTGLNVRVLEALHRGEALGEHHLSGATREELEALVSVYAHLGHNLRKAARAGADDFRPVLHVFRSTGVLARRALLAFNNHRLPAFWAAWGYTVPPDAVTALALMRERLMEVLPSSTGEAD